MRVGLYCGSFDPVTYGHLDVIQRVSAIFDEVVVGVVVGSTRKRYMFSADDRIGFVREGVLPRAHRLIEAGKLRGYLHDRDLYVFDGFAGADFGFFLSASYRFSL